jgi:phospholipid/cholesterol/gamma-HCH transport system substrate-binding protein
MKNRNLIVGLFVLAGLVLFMTGLFLIGNRHEAFARHMDFYADFTNLAGLSKGSKVQVAGMDAGQVLDIAVPASSMGRFRVKLRIAESLHGLVCTDSVATIGTQGVVGETFLLIHPGGPNAPAAPALSLLPSKEPLDISSLLDQGQGLATDVDIAVKDADGLLKRTGNQLGSTLSKANTALTNVNDLVVGLKQGRGAAGMFLNDPELATQIRQTVTNAQQATSDLNRLSGRTNGLMTDILSRNFPQKIDETMATVKSAISNVDASTRQLRQTIAEASEPDDNGATPGLNIRESLSNANAATANIADGTEALKHNFLLRGFFRQRGYFSLDHVSTDMYRKDHLFTNPRNARAWLSSDSMFEKDLNGGEQLTSRGKSMVDAAVTNRGDSIYESPIVVEGYANDANAAEQLALSRSRAILVRHYLEVHFMLDASHIGIVTMGNLPPSGLEHSTWDGVCVVVLSPRT